MTETAIVCQEDDDAENPDDAKLTGSPKTANTVGDEESEESASNRSYLHHGRDVAFDIGVGHIVELIEMENVLKVLGIECSDIL